MNAKSGKRAHGETRPSQIITTFGPGAMMDLPDHSVLISGLDFWSSGGDEIFEPRLAAKLARVCEVPSVRMFTPPTEQEDPNAPVTGIPCFQFPEWFITQNVDSLDPISTNRSRLLVHRKGLARGKYIDRNKKTLKVVPIRFVRACRAGHIGDIDWYSFVHNGKNECASKYRQLWIEERGTSGDLTEVWIRCECGKAQRSVAEASQLQNRSLGLCDGQRPWLGVGSREQCAEPSRLLIRTASNAYFPQKLTVISLPDRDEIIKQAVDAAWDNLEAVETIEELRYERKKSKVKEALAAITDEEAFAELQMRKEGNVQPEKTVKVAELETLIASKEELGDDKPNGNFFARSLPRTVWDRPWMRDISRVILVHRLREVVAQVGFTRFESAAPDTDGELEIGVRRASLGREITWLPAIENRGEGVFIEFDRKAVESWWDRNDFENDVYKRGEQLLAGFDSWKRAHTGTHRVFPGLPYIMLHSFSHMLITSVALECGYPASSIRERIYAIPDVGYGVLLYTGSSDAEGTLGGLIQVGRRIHEHIDNALQLGELCSNDPVCSQHQPSSKHENRHLHGAACHGCLLIAETSCEQQNEFLDRALVVPTMDHLGVEFFRAAKP